jgi:hypothetical protein
MKKFLLATAIVGALVAPAKADVGGYVSGWVVIALSYRTHCGSLPDGVGEKVEQYLNMMSENQRWIVERQSESLGHFVPRYDLPPSSRNAMHAQVCGVYETKLKEQFHE